MKKDYMMHFDEKSWRARRQRSGYASLTQVMYLAASRKTLSVMPQKEFGVHTGSVKGNVFGPVKLDPLTSLPHMGKGDLKA